MRTKPSHYNTIVFFTSFVERKKTKMKQDNVQLEESDRWGLRAILRSECVYGKGWQSPGGQELFDILATNVPSNVKSILVVGCGLGGEVLALKERSSDPNLSIKAVDLSQACIGECKRRYYPEHEGVIEFICGNGADKSLFSDSQFDLVWSRDTFMYIDVASKIKCFNNFHTWLKPDETLLLVDFGMMENQNPHIKRYNEDHGYHPMNANELRRLIGQAGFATSYCDRRALFAGHNLVDLKSFEARRDMFLQIYSEEEYQHLAERWNHKILLASELNGLAYHHVLCKKQFRVYLPVACDMFHVGHLALFQNVKKKFPNCHATIGLHSDEDIESYKNKRPVINLEDRMSIVGSCRYVDAVFGHAPIQTTKQFMKYHGFDLVISGNDYTPGQIKQYFPDTQDCYFQFNYTEGISSTKIKRAISDSKK